MKLNRILMTASAFAMLTAGLLADGTPAAQPPVQGAGEPAAQANAAAQATPVADKTQVSRMRGKLLYKKGQIRKLEKAVTETNAEASAKSANLERQRRELFVAAEPKLAQLYEEQDALEEQIRTLSEALKK